MNADSLRKLLEAVRDGSTSVGDAVQQFRSLPFRDLGFARVDSHRALRCGFPEVILCAGKETQQIIEITDAILTAGGAVLATRADRPAFEAIKAKYEDAEYNEMARTVVIERDPLPKSQGTIMVISAGTSDIPVAEEARVTAEVMGNNVETLYDVGVAGIHRLLQSHDDMSRANVIIVVAGMEGALASVVGGLVDCPVVAVPTSIGYGASFGGIAALLSMLNSCAAGVSVVNIDNGFGAGYVATLINRRKDEGASG